MRPLGYVPGSLAFPHEVAGAWVNINSTTAATIRNQFNVSSITRAAAGTYVVTFLRPFASTNYVVGGMAGTNSFHIVVTASSAAPTASSATIKTESSLTVSDDDPTQVVMVGRW